MMCARLFVDLVFSHLIVLILFFQLGVFVSYEYAESCSFTFCRDISLHGHVWFGNWNVSSYFSSPSSSHLFPWVIHRVMKEDLLSMLKRFSGSLGNEGQSEQALVIHLPRNLGLQSIETTNASARSTARDALQKCQSLKVVFRNISENSCLVILPFEESYHVSRWQISSDGSRYQPSLPVPGSWGEKSIQKRSLSHPFELAREILSTFDDVAADLRQLLGMHPTNSAILLLVVHKDTRHFVPHVSACHENPSLLLVWSLDIDTHQSMQHLSLLSYYDPRLNSTHMETLSITKRVLVSEIVAVQHLILLGYHVLVQRVGSINFRFRHSLSNPVQDKKVDEIVPAMFAGISPLVTPILFVTSSVRTKALWSKLALSVDLIRDGEDEKLDDIVSEYRSLFGMTLAYFDRTELSTCAPH